LAGVEQLLSSYCSNLDGLSNFLGVVSGACAAIFELSHDHTMLLLLLQLQVLLCRCWVRRLAQWPT
jgi:hypothetical protein